MRGVAGLVTCGDADTARYVLSRRFVDGCRALGVSVVWKTFQNRPHDVPEESLRLAREFLAHHHWTHPEDLGGVPIASAAPSFVGDDADGIYYPSGSPEAADVLPEDRVELPSAAVAAAWGSPGRAESGGKPLVTAEAVNGVEVVFVVPNGVRSDARVLVLLGGRGWRGAKSVRELGFAKWAVARGWCLVAPSFAKGGWWNPASGSAEVLRLSVEALRRRHGVRPLPVFLYGYSAGGQLAALLQSRPPFPVAAWAVHGCGVFPEPPPRMGVPALVSCGIGDGDRFALGRTFACRYREAGGTLVWKPARGGHEPDVAVLGLARAFFVAVASGAPCARWGEDDTRRLAPREDIDGEYLNPLYDDRLAELWRRDAP